MKDEADAEPKGHTFPTRLLEIMGAKRSGGVLLAALGVVGILVLAREAHPFYAVTT